MANSFGEGTRQRGVEQVFVHCFLDGRDVPPTSGAGFIRRLKEKCDSLGNARIATVQGRFWGMDRDKRWDRVEKGYNAIVCGEGVPDPDPVHAIEASYAAGVTDEFVEPVVCCPEGAVNQGDSVAEGDVLLIIEAMKMENEVAAPCDGVVKQIVASKGAVVATGDALLVI